MRVIQINREKHGFPTSISPGDQIILTNPLSEGGKTIGKLRAAPAGVEGTKIGGSRCRVPAPAVVAARPAPRPHLHGTRHASREA